MIWKPMVLSLIPSSCREVLMSCCSRQTMILSLMPVMSNTYWKK